MADSNELEGFIAITMHFYGMYGFGVGILWVEVGLLDFDEIAGVAYLSVLTDRILLWCIRFVFGRPDWM